MIHSHEVQGLKTVALAADLSNLLVGPLGYAMAVVSGSKQVWAYNPTSTATTNGTTIVAALGGTGRWELGASRDADTVEGMNVAAIRAGVVVPPAASIANTALSGPHVAGANGDMNATFMAMNLTSIFWQLDDTQPLKVAFANGPDSVIIETILQATPPAMPAVAYNANRLVYMDRDMATGALTMGGTTGALPLISYLDPRIANVGTPLAGTENQGCYAESIRTMFKHIGGVWVKCQRVYLMRYYATVNAPANFNFTVFGYRGKSFISADTTGLTSISVSPKAGINTFRVHATFKNTTGGVLEASRLESVQGNSGYVSFAVPTGAVLAEVHTDRMYQ